MKIRKKSKMQEERIAKEIGGKTVIASGAFWMQKGDVRSDDYLIEAKFTEKTYYTLNLKTWDKIEKEAINDGLRIPAMQIDIDGKKFAVFSTKDFYATYDEIIETTYEEGVINLAYNLAVITSNRDIAEPKKSIRISKNTQCLEIRREGGKGLFIFPWFLFLEMILQCN